LARAEAALSVVHAEYPWYPLRIHARLGVLQEAIIYIGYEITIHCCEDGLTLNTPKMLGRIFGKELYQTKADKIVKKHAIGLSKDHQ
jgi:hypothetical protein